MINYQLVLVCLLYDISKLYECHYLIGCSEQQWGRRLRWGGVDQPVHFHLLLKCTLCLDKVCLQVFICIF